ncbi:MAG: aspartate/glutamate racemase family protein [Bacteroidetes bacterium]|nr:aspartate/glutamate racemase family protein [Bacteroidota bacterium]NCQ10852.1 aspartate/glutamate racemase family protein [Bacteroidota bacterium]
MKTIGLIGGMSWESTQEYYRLLNQGVCERLGGLHSAKILMYSVDFQELETLQHQNKWDEAIQMMVEIAQKLELAGAELMVIGSNTMHLTADSVQKTISIPLVHIADATAEYLKKRGCNNAGLLGTKFTMEKEFYRERMKQLFDISILTPNNNDRDFVHKVIYDELCLGTIIPSSKQEYLRIIDDLIKSGADSIIAGCTEVPLLIKKEDLPLPYADSTEIHVSKILDLAC